MYTTKTTNLNIKFTTPGRELVKQNAFILDRGSVPSGAPGDDGAGRPGVRAALLPAEPMHGQVRRRQLLQDGHRVPRQARRPLRLLPRLRHAARRWRALQDVQCRAGRDAAVGVPRAAAVYRQHLSDQAQEELIPASRISYKYISLYIIAFTSLIYPYIFFIFN